MLDLAGDYQQVLCFHRFDAKESVFLRKKSTETHQVRNRASHTDFLKALQTKYIGPSLRFRMKAPRDPEFPRGYPPIRAIWTLLALPWPLFMHPWNSLAGSRYRPGASLYKTDQEHSRHCRFDSRKLRVLSLPQEEDDYVADAGEGDDSPSPAPHPLIEVEGKMSGMCPV